MITDTQPIILTNREYHANREYIGSTSLKQMLVSPKWFRYCLDHPEESKISQEAELKGSVYHAMLASLAITGTLDDFTREWEVFEPPINDKTGKPYGYDTQKFRDAYDTAMILANGKELCSQSEVYMAKAMIEAMLGDPYLGKDIQFFLDNGTAERSYFVEYDGLKLKFRPDLETRKKIIDWKTCQDASPEAIAQNIIKFNYHLSAALYQLLDYTIHGRWRSFYWVFQEKEPPYDFLIVDASPWSFELQKDGDEQIAVPKEGAKLLLKIIDQYQWCLANNVWPGYSIFVQPDWRGHRIYSPEVPGWYQKQVFEKVYHV